MNAETTIAAASLSSALVRAQAEMSAPRKDREVSVKMKTGGTYKFSYATMAGMVEADKPILAKHGLGFVQFVRDGCMVTRIIHESGDHMDCPLPMPNLPNAPQEAGSLITYFKRYSYSAAFGRVADEEDDGNIAAGNSYTPRDKAPAPLAMITEAQIVTMQTLIPNAGKTVSDICNLYGVSGLEELTEARAKACIKRLQELAKEPANA
jgi:hypothetical protein